jgi:HSP20 family protein
MAQDSTRWLQTFISSAIALAKANRWQPLVDVYRTRNGWLIKYDLAGVAPADVKVTVNGSRLTIRGTRRDCQLQEDCCHHYMEISYSRFERTIELPDNLERARLSLEYQLGMLLVRLEKEARS